jgi:ABC-type transport system involved in multi-copper enzyme maturation permease subunit
MVVTDAALSPASVPARPAPRATSLLRSYGRVLRFELGKAVHTRLTWAILVLPAALAVLSTLIGDLARQAANAASPGLDSVDTAFAGFALGAQNGLILASVLILFYASMLFANEGSQRTFKTIMLRPHRRGTWVAAKLTLLWVLAAMVLVTVVASALATAGSVADYVAAAEEGYVYYEAAELSREAMWAVVLVVPPLLALAAFGLMISALFDHAGLATGTCLGGYVFLEAIKSSTAGARPYMFNSFLPSLLDTSYFAELREFADGVSTAGWETGYVMYNVATPLVSAALFAAVAAVCFRRREFAV